MGVMRLFLRIRRREIWLVGRGIQQFAVMVGRVYNGEPEKIENMVMVEEVKVLLTMVKEYAPPLGK